MWQKHIKQTSNTLISYNTITTVGGLVTFLWQMIVYRRHSQDTADARAHHGDTTLVYKPFRSFTTYGKLAYIEMIGAYETLLLWRYRWLYCTAWLQQLYVFLVPDSRFTAVHLALIIFRHACIGRAQSLVATAHFSVCPSLATPLLCVTKDFKLLYSKVAYAHYGKHFPWPFLAFLIS